MRTILALAVLTMASIAPQRDALAKKSLPRLNHNRFFRLLDTSGRHSDHSKFTAKTMIQRNGKRIAVTTGEFGDGFRDNKGGTSAIYKIETVSKDRLKAYDEISGKSLSLRVWRRGRVDVLGIVVKTREGKEVRMTGIAKKLGKPTIHVSR